MAYDDWGSGGSAGDWDAWGETKDKEAIIPHQTDSLDSYVPEKAGWGHEVESTASIQSLPKNVYEGIVKDVNVTPVAPRNRTFLGAAIRSIRYGVPFCMEDTRIFFNLQSMQTDGGIDFTSPRSVGVTIFGSVESGLLSNGQALRVTGKRGPDNSVFATRLENLTNGTSIDFEPGLDGNVVRGIALVLGALLVVFSGYVFGGGVSLPALPHFDIGRILLYAVIVLLGLWWILQSLRHPSRATLRLVGIILLVLVCVLFPDLGYTVAALALTLYGLWFCIKAILK